MHVDQFLNLKERIESLHGWLIEEELIPPWATKLEAIAFAAKIALVLDLGEEKTHR